MPAFWSSVSELLWNREASVLLLAGFQDWANSRLFLSLFLTPPPTPRLQEALPSQAVCVQQNSKAGPLGQPQAL